MLHLLYDPMPHLQRSWLNQIDMLGIKHDGMIKAMRHLRSSWELLNFQGVLDIRTGNGGLFDADDEQRRAH